MSFWDNFVESLVGRPEKQAQKTPFDPYAQDRQVRMDALRGAMGQYDQMLSTPGGAIPQSYRDYLQKDAEKNVRNANPGAGQSGFTEDRVARAKNDVNIKLMDTELGQLNKQRDYISQLTQMNQPTQMVETSPYQAPQGGMLQKAVGDLAGRATRSLGDVILGTKEDDENSRKPQPYNFGYGNGNGMGVQ